MFYDPLPFLVSLGDDFEITGLCTKRCFFNPKLIICVCSQERERESINMDSTKGWFQKRQMRGGSRYKGGGSNGSADEQPNVQTDEEAVSNTTKQKVAAAKQYIENHYKEQMKILQERKERFVPRM